MNTDTAIATTPIPKPNVSVPEAPLLLPPPPLLPPPLPPPEPPEPVFPVVLFPPLEPEEPPVEPDDVRLNFGTVSPWLSQAFQ